MKELIQEKCGEQHCRSSAGMSLCSSSEAGSVILLYTTGFVPECHACLVWKDGCGELVGGCWYPEPGDNVGDKAELPVLYM